MEKFDPKVRYRGSLQNYLIDTGDEVILVDTGLPAGTPEEVPDENSPLYTGKDISSYMEAFAALGYQPKRRNTYQRNRKSIVLLATEGKNKTETNYFKSIPSLKYVVRFVPGNYTDPVNMMYALKKEYEELDFQIWECSTFTDKQKRLSLLS